MPLRIAIVSIFLRKAASLSPCLRCLQTARVNCLRDSRPYGENTVSHVMFCHVGEYEQNATY